MTSGKNNQGRPAASLSATKREIKLTSPPAKTCSPSPLAPATNCSTASCQSGLNACEPFRRGAGSPQLEQQEGWEVGGGELWAIAATDQGFCSVVARAPRGCLQKRARYLSVSPSPSSWLCPSSVQHRFAFISLDGGPEGPESPCSRIRT